MKWERFTVLTALVLLGLAGQAAADKPVASVRGHGIWEKRKGVDHQPVIESININASVDDEGQVSGRILWTSIYNGMNGDQGPGVSGWTWRIDVDTYVVVSPDEAYVEGTITRSNWADDPEVGLRIGFYVFDGGAGRDDGLENQIPMSPEFASPILSGNFTVRH
jgi:hypothetical protein